MPYKHYADKVQHDANYYAKSRGQFIMKTEKIPKERSQLKPMRHIRIKGPKHGLKIAVIPDVQAKNGVPLDHLRWAGLYIAMKKPDVVVCIGDFADMPSLSHYDVGTRNFEGRRYVTDIEAAKYAMSVLMAPILNMKTEDRPALYMTRGNHEDRIERVSKEDSKLHGLVSSDDLEYEKWGWNVFPFMQPIVIGGVAFCHYFPSGVMGKPITTARSLLTKLHMSCFAGHQQGRDIAYSRKADGGDLTAIISGSFYQHNEDYLTPFTNNHWRGMYMLHEVKDGSFDEMAVSLAYLRRRFKGK